MSEIILQDLLRPFEYNAHKWRVMNVTKAGDKASVAFYIDARDVMDRLDSVVGQANWGDSYSVLVADAKTWIVRCDLTVCGVTKSNVGEGDAAKDAFSDALKRAAVEWGIGRYLYAMDTGRWFPIDQYKQFTPEATKAIEQLLTKNLNRFNNVPSATPQHRQAPPPAQDNPFEDAPEPTPDSVLDAVGDEGLAIINTWAEPKDAHDWAVQVGACANSHEARNSMKKIVDARFGGRLTVHNRVAVFVAFYMRQLEKLPLKVPA